MTDAPSSNWDEEEELKALGRVIHAFATYDVESELEIDRWKRQFNGLPSHHKELLQHIPEKCRLATKAIEVNQFFLKMMLTTAHTDFIAPNADSRSSASDVEKVRYVLKNLVRDWGTEGKNERELCYGEVKSALRDHFKDWEDWNQPPRVLIPGCGLARLVLEIASMGFNAEGNEFSYFMLLPSSFMLNHANGANLWTIHPWILSTCNQITDDFQLRPILIPDRDPREVLGDSKGSLVMIAGDFVEVYARDENHEAFDSVVTSFFMDTAHNIVQYIELILKVLKPGGVWINLGPLLYHWVDSEPDVSIELSLHDIERISIQLGFQLVNKKFIQVPYLANEKAMFQTVYNAVFWTMIKSPQI